MGLKYSTNDCDCCGSPNYVWDASKWLIEPGLCILCDGNQCCYCGKFVNHRDRANYAHTVIHKSCDRESGGVSPRE